MDIFAQAAEKIIKEQEGIIGPVALEQARKVTGLKVNGGVSIEGANKTEVLSNLVAQYEQLFGQASVEVCKQAVSGLQLPPQSIPALQ